MDRLFAWYRGTSGATKARVWLLAAAAILLVVVIFGGKPWQVDLPEGKELRVGDYARLWLWPAALFNLLLLGFLAWVAPLWTVRTEPLCQNRPSPTPRWFWPAVLSAALLLAICAAARMDQSLWHDEASRTKRTMVGAYREKDNGAWTFRRIGWEKAFFESELPNHVLQSVLSKASHDLWLAAARPKGFPISEAAMRVPALLAGIAGLVLLALLLKWLGSAAAGAWAAWILALHPWFLRYASEARGYSLVMACLPLLLLAFCRAVQTGRTRWWVVFATTQFVMVYACATALYIPLVLNLCAPFVFLQKAREGFDPMAGGAKWLVANILSAAAFLQLFLPCAPQLLAYLASDKGGGLGNVMNVAWFQNVLAHLWLGIPWSNWFEPRTSYFELLPLWADHPILVPAAALLSLALAMAGIWRATRLGAYGALAAAVFLLPAALSIAEASLRGTYLYEWYVVYLVPGVVALVAWGGEQFLRWMPSRTFRLGALVVFGALSVTYAVGTQPQRWWLLTNSLQPYREAVLAIRPSLDPNAPGQASILTAFFHGGPLAYDPRVERCSQIADLAALMHRADAEQKSLFLTLAYRDSSISEHPSKWRLVLQSGLFEDAGWFRGFYPSLDIRVFRYRMGSAQGFDFTPYPDDIPSSKSWMDYH